MWKPKDEFYRQADMADGRKNLCRICIRREEKRWRLANVERDRERQRRYRQLPYVKEKMADGQRLRRLRKRRRQGKTE